MAVCLQNIAGCAVGDWWWQINQKNSQSYKKELKLAFGIDMIIDHVTFILQTMYGEGVKRQKKLVPFRWSCPTSEKSTCEVSEEQIITEFNYMITFRFASMLRCL